MDEQNENIQSSKLAFIGQQLKEAREQKGYTLNYVAEVSRIHIGLLEEIEDGKLSNSPGPVFLRGFIRTYAKLVGLDDNALLKEAEFGLEKAGTSEKTPSTPPSSGSKGPYLLILVVVLLLGGLYLVYFQMQGGEEDVAPASPEPTATTTVSTEGETEESSESSTSTEDSEPSLPSDTETPSTEDATASTTPDERDASDPVETAGEMDSEEMDIAESDSTDSDNAGLSEPTDETASTPAEEDGVSETDTAVASAEEGNLVLTIRGKNSPTWLNVTIDERDAKEVLVLPGEQVVYRAEERYRLTVGNTKEVEVLLNGEVQSMDQRNDLLIDWELDATSIVQ